jgi:hypothetical protein
MAPDECSRPGTHSFLVTGALQPHRAQHRFCACCCSLCWERRPVVCCPVVTGRGGERAARERGVMPTGV